MCGLILYKTWLLFKSVFEKLLNNFPNRVFIGKYGIHQFYIVRHRNIRKCKTLYGSVQVPEQFIRNRSTYFSTKTGCLVIFVHNEAAAGFFNRIKNHLFIPGHDGAKVYDIV